MDVDKLLSYGQLVLMTLTVNEKQKEINRLEYVGRFGMNGWLHFVNVRTKENHLVMEHQFPEHVYRMDGATCKLHYSL